MTERTSRRGRWGLRPLLLAGAVALGWTVITAGSAQADDTITSTSTIGQDDTVLTALHGSSDTSGGSERHHLVATGLTTSRHAAAQLPHLPGPRSMTSTRATPTSSASHHLETPRATTHRASGDRAAAPTAAEPAPRTERSSQPPLSLTAAHTASVLPQHDGLPAPADLPMTVRELGQSMHAPAPRSAGGSLRRASALVSQAASVSPWTSPSSVLTSIDAPALERLLQPVVPVLASALAHLLPALEPPLGPLPDTVLTPTPGPAATSTGTTSSPLPLAPASLARKAHGAAQAEPGGAALPASLRDSAGPSSTVADPAPTYVPSPGASSDPAPTVGVFPTSPAQPSPPGAPWLPGALSSSSGGWSSSSRSSGDDLSARREDRLAAPAAGTYAGATGVAGMSSSPAFAPGFSPD